MLACTILMGSYYMFLFDKNRKELRDSSGKQCQHFHAINEAY